MVYSREMHRKTQRDRERETAEKEIEIEEKMKDKEDKREREGISSRSHHQSMQGSFNTTPSVINCMRMPMKER
jgi:hypothetical protein